jgi:hypothetical protein
MPTKDEAELLQIPMTLPVLEIVRVGTSAKDDLPIEVTQYVIPSDLRLDLGPAGLPEPELAPGRRVLPGVHLGMPRPARQLLYVTAGPTRQATQLQISSVHEPVTNRPVKA